MVNGMLCARFDYTPFKPTPNNWFIPGLRRVGVYKGDIDVWTITAKKDGALWIYSDDERRDVSCVPLDECHFACAFGLFEFVLDDQGEVRKHIKVLVDGRNLRDRRRLSDGLAEDSEVYVFQALSGG